MTLLLALNLQIFLYLYLSYQSKMTAHVMLRERNNPKTMLEDITIQQKDVSQQDEKIVWDSLEKLSWPMSCILKEF